MLCIGKLLENGGLTAIFRKIACIGDSMSSGEFQIKNDDGSWTYLDMFEYSWGQFIARMTGSVVYNFSAGGMTARYYCQNFAQTKGYWDKELKAQAYIIALGVNDLINRNQELGEISDIDLKDYNNNKDTYIGNFAKIIQRYKEIEPNAKFFLVTMPKGDDNEKKQIHQQTMYKLAEIFTNTYVIDLFEYAPIHDEDYKSNNYMYDHLTPSGYYETARQISTYIDYIVKNNFKDFAKVGLIGTSHYKD